MTTLAPLNSYTGRNGVAIVRPGPWGNPYVMKRKDALERARVCRKFHRWWYDDAQASLRQRALRELTDKVLLCHCKRNQCCHGMTIATYVNWMHEVWP